MTTLIPRRRRPHATTVCAICAAIYLTTDVHTCTQETPTEGDPMLDHPDKITAEAGIALPGDRNRHRDIRLACVQLAAETGMTVGDVLPTAKTWADWILGTEPNQHITR